MRQTGRRTRGTGPDSSPWDDVDNWLSERRTDPDYITQTSTCCNHHPDAHDELVGCLLCGCEATVDRDAQGRIWEEEVQVLVGGATILMAQRVSRTLGVTWEADHHNGHRYVDVWQWRRIAKQLRLLVSVQERLAGTGVGVVRAGRVGGLAAQARRHEASYHLDPGGPGSGQEEVAS